MSARTIVVTDIHGCFDEFMLLLDKVQYGDHDRLLVAGDMVDRGPESGKVVRWVRNAHARTNGLTTSILGNHDEKHVRWHKHMLRKRHDRNYHVPMFFSDDKIEAYNQMSDEDLEFLSNLPLFIHLQPQDWVVVHAGLEPGKELDKQDVRKMTHIRYLSPETMKTVSLGHNFSPPDGSIYWTDCYDLPHHVVYGHNVHGLKAPRIIKKNNGAQLVGLDTGCCFGGRLSAFLVPETKEEQVTPDNFFQVQSARTYSKSTLFHT